ncbi:MAG: GNAT family N-acetyltransferase [Bacteroidales bacterium]|nr:GNAT family N-acetyltransferase [Bacteroidales bacterium]
MTFNTAPCTAQHLQLVMSLQQQALDTAGDNGTLRRNSPEMLAACLHKPHLTLGAWAGNTLAAIAILYVPTPGDPEDLAPLLSHPSEVASANYKLCIVAPPYRGHGLQRILGAELERQASQRGIGQLCATVSPLNAASLYNLQRLGYHIDRELQKYGSTRLLVYKTL